MNGLYICGQLDLEQPGIGKRIRAQLAALDESCCHCSAEVYTWPTSTMLKCLRRLPGCKGLEVWPVVQSKSYDYFYLRKPIVTASFIRFLSDLRRRYPKTAILFEMPTYPYDSEMKTLKFWPLLLKERYHRRYLKRYVDRIVDLSGHDEIFGIPTIQIINGIDLETINPKMPSGTSASSTLHLACAANFQRWHGIDRLLLGLTQHKAAGGGRKIQLHLMGEGPEASHLKALAGKLALGDSVVFYGQCDRTQMDRVYDRCSLAVECLGNHRKGLTLSSSLKSREYLAKGIPFIYSGEIDVFERDPVDFCLRVPSDESPVDIEKLVNFHDDLYCRESEQELISRIRRYAVEHVSMDAAMANVIEYIKENCR